MPLSLARGRTATPSWLPAQLPLWYPHQRNGGGMSHPCDAQVRWQASSTTTRPHISFSSATPSRSGRTTTTTRSLVWDRKFPYDSDVRTREYGYLLFGSRHASTTSVSVEQRYTYTGREANSLSTLTYSRYRQYDPGIGRFAARDPIGYRGGISIYGYVLGRPIRWIDPYGLGPRRYAGNGQWVDDDGNIWNQPRGGTVVGNVPAASSQATPTPAQAAHETTGGPIPYEQGIHGARFRFVTGKPGVDTPANARRPGGPGFKDKLRESMRDIETSLHGKRSPGPFADTKFGRHLFCCLKDLLKKGVTIDIGPPPGNVPVKPGFRWGEIPNGFRGPTTGGTAPPRAGDRVVNMYEQVGYDRYVDWYRKQTGAGPEAAARSAQFNLTKYLLHELTHLC
jgi:RHS repeat-associated protein